MVLKDLAEDCPFEQMRVASVGLLREVVASKFDRLVSLSVFLGEARIDLLGEQELDSQEPSTPLTDRPSVLEPPVPFTSLFLSPLLLAELSSTLLRFDSVDLLTPPPTREPIDVTSFIKTHSKSTMEKLSLLYLLLARDEGDLVSCLVDLLRPMLIFFLADDRPCHTSDNRTVVPLAASTRVDTVAHRSGAIRRARRGARAGDAQGSGGQGRSSGEGA